MPGRRALLVALCAVALLSAGGLVAGGTFSAFSSSTSNSANTFSAAASFGGGTCPSTRPAVNWLTGMEHGMDTTAGGGMWQGGSGNAIEDTAVARNGSYSLKTAPAGAALYRSRLSLSFPYAKQMTWRFAIRLATLPSANVGELFAAYSSTSGGPAMRLGYDASTQKFTLGLRSSSTTYATPVQAGSTVAAGTWYVVDLRYDVSADPHTADWRIDGVAQPQASIAAPAGDIQQWLMGTTLTTDTYTANFDDIAQAENATSYPFGDGKVLALRPDGMGTSVGASNFHNDDLSPINSTSWMRLADLPMTASTDYVEQGTLSTTSYLEMTVEDTAETCIRNVGAFVVYDQLAQNATNHGKTVVTVDGVERVVNDADMAGTTYRLAPRYAVLQPVQPTWSQASVNGLRWRIGYSSDVSPPPNWHSLLIEYEVPQ